MSTAAEALRVKRHLNGRHVGGKILHARLAEVPGHPTVVANDTEGAWPQPLLPSSSEQSPRKLGVAGDSGNVAGRPPPQSATTVRSPTAPQSAPPQQQQAATTNMYVKGIPLTWRNRDLLAFFQQYGAVDSAVVLREKNVSRGLGLVRMSDPATANHLISRGVVTTVGWPEPIVIRSARKEFASTADQPLKRADSTTRGGLSSPPKHPLGSRADSTRSLGPMTSPQSASAVHKDPVVNVPQMTRQTSFRGSQSTQPSQTPLSPREAPNDVPPMLTPQPSWPPPQQVYSELQSTFHHHNPYRQTPPQVQLPPPPRQQQPTTTTAATSSSQQQQQQEHRCRYCEHGTSIIISNLHEDKRHAAEQLHHILSGFGTVNYSEIIGQQAIVTFTTHGNALMAVKSIGSPFAAQMFDCVSTPAPQQRMNTPPFVSYSYGQY